MTEQANSDFYIVGIGASAGGLEALEKFFGNMPADSGLAFVVVQHLSPDYKSLMAELLSKHTQMPVYEVQDGMSVEPNNIYLIPRKKTMTIFHGKLHLTDRGQEQLNLPIDIFLRSLAEDMGERAIAIILSGTGSDGTRGIRAVKEAGGMVMAQDTSSAKFEGMPQSAIATQLVDYILSAEQMSTELVSYIQHSCISTDLGAKPAIAKDEDNLSKIYAKLRSQAGVDFTYYKQSTMVRRIERRMSINQIDRLSDYLHYLYQSPNEVQTLYKELLIGVTKFFRDTEAFEFIGEKVIPEIFKGRSRNDQVRVWVAACSTGEEAYSLAILFSEYMEKSGNYLDVKIFATDLDKAALEYAGKGVYAESIAADVSLERLKNYFIKRGDSYEVLRRVREMVIFAQQNIITDPPFSKIDLVTCRNVLIYFQSVLQKKVLSMFQFSLKQDGFLFLGTSETVGDNSDFFLSYHNKWRVYQYRGGFRPLMLEHGNVNIQPRELQPRGISYGTRVPDDRRINEIIYRGLIEKFMPP